jgi:uncharacterized protein Yka (UPF0111/DUF47 family)
MADPLSDAIEELRRSSARLNEITDKAAETVRRIEDFLNDECSLGIEASVKTKEEQDDGLFYSRLLAYRRYGAKYRIVVEEEDTSCPDPWTIKAWSDCTREVKLETFPWLPELIKKIAAEVDKTIKEAEQVSQTVTQMVQSLQKKGG